MYDLLRYVLCALSPINSTEQGTLQLFCTRWNRKKKYVKISAFFLKDKPHFVWWKNYEPGNRVNEHTHTHTHTHRRNTFEKLLHAK